VLQTINLRYDTGTVATETTKGVVMEKRILGRTGLEVSVLGMGGLSLPAAGIRMVISNPDISTMLVGARICGGG